MTRESDIEATPFVSVDLDILQKNINDMQAIAEKAGAVIRPHVKTHKSIDITNMQIDAGAKGITVAKPEEAIAFIKAGVDAVKICYPIISKEKMSAVIACAKEHNAELRFSIDNKIGFNVLNECAQTLSYKCKAYLEIDVGLKRCGFTPEDPEILDIAKEIEQSEFVELVGLSAHAGQSYGAKGIDDAKAIATEENNILEKVKDSLERQNISVQNICIGATPTLWVQDNFDGITELKPGNYVFNDLTQKNIGVVGWERLALSVIATVVSINDTYMIIDAGSKTMTSDAGAHGTSNVKGFGIAFTLDETAQDNGLNIAKLSEEHGFIEHHGKPLEIGTKIRIYPNHACPVVNLFNKLHIFKDGELHAEWDVTARGCNH